MRHVGSDNVSLVLSKGLLSGTIGSDRVGVTVRSDYLSGTGDALSAMLAAIVTHA